MMTDGRKTINGRDVYVRVHSVRERLQMKLPLMKLFGGTIGEIFNQIVIGVKGGFSLESLLDANIDFKKLLIEVGSSCSESELLTILDRILKNTTVDGKFLKNPHEFDAIFGDDLMLVYEVAAFALEVNYKDFFSRIGTGLGLEKRNSVPTSDTSEMSNKD